MVLFSVQSEDVVQAERGKHRIPKTAFEIYIDNSLKLIFFCIKNKYDFNIIQYI